MLYDIFNIDEPIHFFGNLYEMFGFSFHKSNWGKVAQALETGAAYDKGIMRYFYRAYVGKPLDKKELFEADFRNQPFTFVKDYTNDMDMESEYRDFCENVIKGGRLNDVPRFS